MRQSAIFLTLSQAEFGVDELLKVMPILESLRPSAPPDSTAVHTAAGRTFPSGVRFELHVNSPLPDSLPTAEGVTKEHSRLIQVEDQGRDLGVDMLWYYFKPPQPQRDVQPARDTGAGQMSSKSWFLELGVCEDYSPWLKPGKDRDLRQIRSTLDGFAQPRLIVPATNVEQFRDDYIALIGIFAAKAKCLAPQDGEFPTFFRRYCGQCFSRIRQRSRLTEAEWHSAVDRVFRRLYAGDVGAGFTMPTYPESFRSYLSSALRGAVVETRDRDRRHQTGVDTNVLEGAPEAGNSRERQVVDEAHFPSSIAEAADRLGVSHMTVRRMMKRLGYDTWTQEAWMQIADEWKTEDGWRMVCDRLQQDGRSKKTAMQCIRRWRKKSLSLSDALLLSGPFHK